MVQDRDIVTTEATRKSYVSHQLTPIPMTLNDLKDHWLIASFLNGIDRSEVVNKFCTDTAVCSVARSINNLPTANTRTITTFLLPSRRPPQNSCNVIVIARSQKAAQRLMLPITAQYPRSPLLLRDIAFATGVNPAGNAGDTSPQFFGWGTSMGISPPILLCTFGYSRPILVAVRSLSLKPISFGYKTPPIRFNQAGGQSAHKARPPQP